MTQTEQVLALLRAHPEGITPLQAQREIGTMRLAARISDLRERGYDVRSERVVVPTRGGGRTSVARYVLVEKLAEQLVAGL